MIEVVARHRTSKKSSVTFPARISEIGTSPRRSLLFRPLLTEQNAGPALHKLPVIPSPGVIFRNPRQCSQGWYPCSNQSIHISIPPPLPPRPHLTSHDARRGSEYLSTFVNGLTFQITSPLYSSSFTPNGILISFPACKSWHQEPVKSYDRACISCWRCLDSLAPNWHISEGCWLHYEEIIPAECPPLSRLLAGALSVSRTEYLHWYFHHWDTHPIIYLNIKLAFCFNGFSPLDIWLGQEITKKQESQSKFEM